MDRIPEELSVERIRYDYRERTSPFNGCKNAWRTGTKIPGMIATKIEWNFVWPVINDTHSTSPSAMSRKMKNLATKKLEETWRLNKNCQALITIRINESHDVIANGDLKIKDQLEFIKRILSEIDQHSKTIKEIEYYPSKEMILSKIKELDKT